jgi:hypothetical protein
MKGCCSRVVRRSRCALGDDEREVRALDSRVHPHANSSRSGFSIMSLMWMRKPTEADDVSVLPMSQGKSRNQRTIA